MLQELAPGGRARAEGAAAAHGPQDGHHHRGSRLQGERRGARGPRRRVRAGRAQGGGGEGEGRGAGPGSGLRPQASFSARQDGVVLGADTRATEGMVVADKNCSKIHYISSNI